MDWDEEPEIEFWVAIDVKTAREIDESVKMGELDLDEAGLVWSKALCVNKTTSHNDDGWHHLYGPFKSEQEAHDAKKLCTY